METHRAVRSVAVLYNLKKGIATSLAPDEEAEYDAPDTVRAICKALEEGGISPLTLEADENLPEKLRSTHFDMAFNIAEGLRGRGREGQTPALLDMLHIPYTGSDETTLCLALDKALTKRLLNTYHIRTPRYELCEPGQTRPRRALSFPVIVKPDCEGSSKGIGGVSLADNGEELRALLEKNAALYREPMLVEEYVEGREFTVGVLGNGESARALPPMEIVFTKPTEGKRHVYSYPVKQDYQNFVRYECPASLTSAQDAEMRRMTLIAYNALKCRDFGRADFRMDASGHLYFIEINPLPGLAPGYSDYPCRFVKHFGQ